MFGFDGRFQFLIGKLVIEIGKLGTLSTAEVSIPYR